jgi:hypothetical protein
VGNLTKEKTMAQKLPQELPATKSGALYVTKEQMEQAFEAWEKGYRIEPEKFRTLEECKFLGVSQLSAERADYFYELLLIARG